jgi:hypothetical protein
LSPKIKGVENLSHPHTHGASTRTTSTHDRTASTHSRMHTRTPARYTLTAHAHACMPDTRPRSARLVRTIAPQARTRARTPARPHVRLTRTHARTVRPHRTRARVHPRTRTRACPTLALEVLLTLADTILDERPLGNVQALNMLCI